MHCSFSFEKGTGKKQELIIRDMPVFLLKIIAADTMLIDHVGYGFFPEEVIFRSIGRVAFPLYAFLLAEGYYHIKDDPEKEKRHFRRIVLLTVVSEVIYDLFMTGKVWDPQSQSVMPTLLLGMMGLMVAKRYEKKPVIVYGFSILTMGVAHFLHPNYGLMGVLMIYFFYWYTSSFRKTPFLQKYIILLGFSAVWVLGFNWFRFGFPDADTLVKKSLDAWQWMAPFPVIDILIASYKGENGYKNRVLNTLYAWFYPAHLLVLAILELCMGIVHFKWF